MGKITFTEWVFGQEQQRDAEDIVAKLANTFKSDRNWPIGVDTKEALLSYLHSKYQSMMVGKINSIHATADARMPLDEIGQEFKHAVDHFLSNYNSAKFAARIAWDDYEKYLAGK